MGCRTESTAPSHCRNQSPISHACTIALEGTHMADSEPPVHKLQVANARPEDSGRGIAHLPRALMAQLALAEGGVIEIVGKRSTPARAVSTYTEDAGLDNIRLDGLQRATAGAGPGDLAQLPNIKAKTTTPAALQPNDQHPTSQNR